MKLSIKGIALVSGILMAIFTLWSVLVKLAGAGSVPYDLISQFYLGLVPPSIGGAFIGAVIGFIDGFIFGALLSWIYNRVAG